MTHSFDTNTAPYLALAVTILNGSSHTNTALSIPSVGNSALEAIFADFTGPLPYQKTQTIMDATGKDLRAFLIDSGLEPNIKKAGKFSQLTLDCKNPERLQNYLEAQAALFFANPALQIRHSRNPHWEAHKDHVRECLSAYLPNTQHLALQRITPLPGMQSRPLPPLQDWVTKRPRGGSSIQLSHS